MHFAPFSIVVGHAAASVGLVSSGVFVATTAFAPPTPSLHVACPSCYSYRRHLGEGGGESDAEGDSSSSSRFDMSELTRRIEGVAAADVLEKQLDEANNDSSSIGSTTTPMLLPAIAFDALLPGQRLSGTTTDPTFARFLRDLGLGGLFVMISLNYKQRKLRRNGVVARIELVDAVSSGSGAGWAEEPTAVDFTVVGRRRCRVVGPCEGMERRVGRWRRVYDDEGEESRLGWGVEKFVDFPLGTPVFGDETGTEGDDGGATLHHSDWNLSEITFPASDEGNDPFSVPGDVVAQAETLLPLLDRWTELASNSDTYDNTDVVATARIEKGKPGLRLNASSLLKLVKSDLGPMPPPTEPTELAFWAAALINPLPPLGVSPEIRGRVLEATDARDRLAVVEWGVRRSIKNLEGNAPL